MVGGAIWEAATGQMLRPFRMTGVQRATLSQDGRQLICLVGSPSGTTSSVAFWDIVAGRKTRTIPLKGGGLQTWAITRDARQFVTAGYTDQKANVWDTASGQQLRTLWGHNGRIKVLEYSPDGRLLLSGSDDRTAVLWDRATGNRLRVLIGHESGIDAAAFSPDSQRVLTVAGYSKQAILWDTATGEKIRSFAIEEHVHRVAFSPDGRYVANDGDRGTPGSGVLVLRDPETGQAIRSFPGHQHPFGYLAFSPDGKSLLTAINQAATSYAVAYDVTQDHAPREYRGRICVSTLLSFSPDDRRMLSATADGRVTVWDLPAGRRVHNVTIEGTDYVQAAQFSPDGRMIAAGAGNSQARRGWTMVWETATGRPLHRLEGHEGLVMGLAFSSDGRRLVSCALPGDPIVWDLTTGKEVRRLSDEGNQLKRLAFSPDGQEIHGYSFDNRLGRGRIVAWTAETGKQVRSVSAGEGSISTATFSPDVRLLAAMVSPRGEWKPKLVVWECETGRQLHAWENIMSIAFVPFSADSRQLTVLGGDLQSPESVVYDLESGQKLRTYPELLVCGRRQDGRVLLTVGWDGVIRLVDTHSRRELVQLYVLDDGKEWLAVGPDGRFDGSEGGRKLITFRVDDTLGVVPVERFHDKFYHPNLLAEIWKALQ
jgi:WD40 repeat protein